MHEADELSENFLERLDYYVYLYIDPSDNKIFYVGKGNGDRAISHLYDQEESKKTAKIVELIEKGYQPRIEILRYGLNNKTAFDVEAAVIDAIGIENLTNENRGSNTERGRVGFELLKAIIEPIEVEIEEPVVLIRINQLYRHGISDQELYDATRGIWGMGDRRYGADYAFSVYRGIVVDVYKIKSWHPAGTTPYPTRPNLTYENLTADGRARCEFIRSPVIEPEIREKYRMKSVRKYLTSRSEFLYVNC